jgi:hypothetical protein
MAGPAAGTGVDPQGTGVDPQGTGVDPQGTGVDPAAGRPKYASDKDLEQSPQINPDFP